MKTASHLKTFTDLEYKLLPHTFRKRTEDTIGGRVSPCTFNKYANGTRPAAQKHVDLANIEFPGTGKIYNHPFWDVIDSNNDDIDNINSLLTTLRPEVRDILFTNHNHHYFKKNGGILHILKLINEHDDIDALTAYMGILREAIYYDDKAILVFTKKYILKLFHRAVTLPPLCYIADELFEHIKNNFLLSDTDNTWIEEINSYNLSLNINLNHHLLNFVDELNVLRHHDIVPIYCIHIAREQLKVSQLLKLLSFTTHEELNELVQSPEAKNIKRRIRYWEKKTIHLSPSSKIYH